MKLAVITGGSGGIGLELARCAARDGYNVLLVASGAERLAAAAEGLRAHHPSRQIETLVADLSTAAGVELVGIALADRPVAVLINNAGFATAGAFATIELAPELAEIRLNVEALTHLTHLVLPGMLKRRSGHILNVASMAAFLPGPYMATYYATKAYVLSLSEGLAAELAGTGVGVTALCPGPTQSGFAKRAKVEHLRSFRGHLPSAASVAEAGWRGTLAGRRLVVPGASNKLAATFLRFVPRRILAWAVRHVQIPS